ncbi:MAG: GldG family protein [Candidatus Adiutrix sp.]|jgi:hypothetical protein|nr:GldG family protein [Candidatus Adiutrix sp.]
MGGRHSHLCRNLALAALLAAALGYLAAPGFLGFAVLPLAASLLLSALAGPAQWRADWAALTSPSGRGRLLAALALLLTLAAALALGSLRFPTATLDFSRGRTLALAPATLELLAQLDQPVAVTIHLGPQSPRLAQVRELMDHYLRAAPRHFTVTYVNPQTEAAGAKAGPRLVAPDTAEITAEGFRENISPVSEESLHGTLTRLLRPQRRLIYFLNTFGEKMVQDQNFGGLSQWAADLSAGRLTALDYYWPEDQPLPLEASALVLAGPRAPLGEGREKRLEDYLKSGGKLLIMADPLTVAVSQDFWALFGLKMPDGLVVDPETNLAGTGDGFVVSHDYPAHPLTRGLAGPVVWPLTGAFFTRDDGHAQLPATIYALALSSPSAWLETTPTSFLDRSSRYQAGSDSPGPLTLAVAAELTNGGRLLALADSDLAANGFRGFAGNRRFTVAAVHWLLDGEAAPQEAASEAQSLILSHVSARLVFWLPALVWPALVLAFWLIYYLKRHQR